MPYFIKKWYQHEDKATGVELNHCGNLEVVKQVIDAIDNAQNFEATIEELDNTDQS